jgi:putative adenylate-forming enzyme
VSVSLLDETFREIKRGNGDIETLLFPSFYLGCKVRFRTMRPEDIARYQLKKARNVVRYAVRYSRFFGEHYRGHDLCDVWSLPTVDKATMMAHLTDYNTLGLTRDEILDFCLHVERTRDFSLRLQGVNVGMSSGTSGNKSVEITTRREENYMRAALFARFPFPKTKINLAFILRVSSPAFQINRFGHRLTYISQMNTLEAIRERLQRLDPNVISAPPSMLRILAREVERSRLSISPLQVISYAEVLYPEDKAYIGQVFGCPVYEIYKATEGAIAISCHHGSLHINEDLVAVQVFNADGTPTPPGTPSYRMVVTDYLSRLHSASHHFHLG